MTDQMLKIMGGLVGALSALIGTSMALVSWSYDTFESKELANERQGAIEKRLDRIELKIDSIRERH